MSRTLGAGLARGGRVIIETAAGQTTDGTTVNPIWTYDIGDLNEVAAVIAHITWVEDVSSPTIYGTRHVSAFVRGNGSGTATRDQEDVHGTHTTGTAPAGYTINVSGTDVRVEVTGVASTTLNWACFVTLIRSGDTT